METRKHLLAVIAFACSLCGFATDYYVDAVNGNDANDGLAAGEGHAMESFAALFAKYTITSGDKVHAAAGTYAKGVMGTTKYRLVVPAGVEVIGAGANSTTIEGQAHTNELGEVADLTVSPFGCGANALRGVYLGQGAILRKFTITKAYSNAYSDSGNGGGVGSASGKAGYLIDCVITGCVGGRGAGSANTTAVRCHFYGNRSQNTGSDIWGGSAFNCLFGDCLNTSQYNVYQGGPYVNNTFYGSGKCAHASSGTILLYNSVILKEPNSRVSCTNSVLTSASITRYESVKISSAAGAKLDANKRPLRDSPCIDIASWDDYTNKFPSAIRDEAGKDFLGSSRVVGTAIDAGACESPFTADGAFAWYVDAANGSDANDGMSAATAFQNLSMALTNSYLRAGDTVHAAPGLYTNGVINSGNGRKYRAEVPLGVTLVGDAGAERTVIVGEPDPDVALDESPWGCGPNAVQCVRFRDGGNTSTATIRGFTLTGGHSPSFETSSAFGGALYCGDDRSNIKQSGFVIDCIVTNNYAARGAGVTGAISIRCRFLNNRSRETGCDVYSGRAYNCLFGDVANTGTYNFYGSGSATRCINCTFVGSGYAGAMSSVGCGFCNCLVLKNVAIRMIMTNCVYTGTLDSTSSAVNSRKVASVEAVHLDGSYRPLRNSPALDAANVACYTLPDDLPEEAGYDFLKAARVQGLGLDIGALESSETSVGTNWYVNVATGNDENDGTTSATAFKTLAGAMANERVISNDVIHVAAGVYSTGTMSADSKNYRVVVPAGATLLGAGADVTTIEGAEDYVNGTEAGYYCGAGAVSCVRLYAGSMVRGFTLTKGRAPAWTGSGSVNWGGAVVATGVDNAAYVVDCVLTNNFAGRGAGLYGGTAIRCRFSGNGVATTGTDIMQGRAWNCIFGSIVNTGGSSLCSVYQTGPYVNCVFYGTGNASHDASDDFTNIWNSVVLKTPGQHVKLVRCVTTSGASYLGEGSSTMTQAAMMLDENYAPMAGSTLIDRGRSDLYYAKFPEAVADVLAKTDIAGTQRIYNDTIDIGAFEYDWRGDFAKTLKRSQVEVVSASAAVVTNGVRSLTVPSDASIEIDWSVKADGQHTFYVVAEGEGSVSVTCGGEALEPAVDGLCTFIGVKGETRRIVVSCSDGARAVLRDFRDFDGFVISFR